MTTTKYQPRVSEGDDWGSGCCPTESALQHRLSEIQEFFAGRSVLVTGATGFMGKVLLEKLLRSCPGIGTIYIIVRPRKGRSVAERVEGMMKDSVFSRLHQAHWSRVVPVSGDVSQPRMGLSEQDVIRLCEDVSVVFHLAATVRFDEPLRVATCINVKGTRELLCLCRDMKKLQAVGHLSTVFSQFPRSRVEERHYDAPISAAKLMALCDDLQPGEQHDQELANRLLGAYANTYVFTKAVAEAMIVTDFPDLPVAIIRPAVVSSTNEEPYPGWTDNLNGPTGFLVGAYVGLVRVVRADKTCITNLVPCDMTMNCVIAAVWDLAASSHVRGTEKPLYNYVSSCDSPLLYGDYMKKCVVDGHKVPTMRAFWYFSLRMIRNKVAYLILTTLLHLLPAIIVDTSRILTGKSARLLRLYRKVYHANNVYAAFATRFWDFDNVQAKALWSRLSKRDCELFPFDMRNFDWDLYFFYFVRGARVLLLKDGLETVPAAKTRWRRLMWLHTAVKALLFLVLAYIAWNCIYSYFYRSLTS